MATQRKKPPADIGLDQDSIEDLVDTKSARDAIREKLAIDSDVETTIHVYQVNPETKVDFKIWQGDADAFNLESLAKTYGSGTYRIRVYVRNPDGSKPLQFNVLQPWKLSPADQAKVVAAETAAKNPPVEEKHNGADARDLVQQMMAGFQQIVAPLLVQPTKVDPMAQLKEMAEVMRALAPPPAPADPFTQISGMLGLMEKLKSFTGGAAPEGSSATEALMLKAADAFLPAVAKGIVEQRAPAAPASSSTPAAAALPAPAAPEPQLTEEQQHMDVIQRLKVEAFRLQLKMANKAAARGVNPEEYANTIYDAFDEDDIIGLALEQGWFDVMCAADPGCAPHREWYGRVRDAIIKMAVEDEILQAAPDGTLTLAPGEGTTKETTKGPGNGTAGAGTGAAASIKP